MTRDQLEAVARACGLDPINGGAGGVGLRVNDTALGAKLFNPESDIESCALMCIGLGIIHDADKFAIECKRGSISEIRLFREHGGCRMTAWQHAACAVAVKITEGK